MKTTVNLIVISLGLIYLPMAWFMMYLVYSHIQATELMWFLFWVNIPFNLLTTIVLEIAKRLKD